MVDEMISPRFAATRRLLAMAIFVPLLFAGPASAEAEKTTAVEVVEAPMPQAGAPNPGPEPEPEAPLPSEAAAGSDVGDSNAAKVASPSRSESEAVDEPELAPAELDWTKRVEILTERIRTGVSKPADADALYRELATELWTYQDEVYEALRRRSPDALNQRARLTEIYSARMRLIEWVTPELRESLMGGGSTGMRELRREFANAKLDFFFQSLAIPRGLRRLLDSVRESPLDDLWLLLQLLFGVVVFRSWRRWAKTGLGRMRSQVLSIRPRANFHVHVARFLWYLHRFRGPLEWLALLVFSSSIFAAGDLEEVTTLLWVVVLWTLLTRFGMLLVDAIASHSVDGPASANAALRLRSLRVVAGWIFVTGLGLDLSSRYVGEGAMHAWATRTFILLLGPVLLLLLHWWRRDIIQRLGEEARHSKLARRLGKREKGLASYLNAAAGAVYLVGAELLQFSVRAMSGFEAGRKVVAILLRREVERDVKRESVSEKRISEELALQLLTPDDEVIDGPFRDGLQRIVALTEKNRGAAVAVLAERGGGMSTFLRLLANELGDSVRIVDCPLGGIDRFHESLAEEFGLSRTADLTQELRPRLDELGIRVIAIDNFHRIARPMMGGLAGVDRASAISEAAGEDIVWIIGVTRAAWPYISRARGDRAILQEVLELPPWSDEQLEELLDARSKAAEIEPDYRRLVFPRQFDDGERETLEARNRFGYRRVLWELSDGNPAVAIRLFTDSLRELPSGKLIVRLPQPASGGKVTSTNPTTLLVLRGLVECELATVDDLTASIRVPRSTVANALAYCIQEGWAEEFEDHYRITWDWYRTIKRLLVRRNLIAR